MDGFRNISQLCTYSCNTMPIVTHSFIHLFLCSFL